MIDVDWRGLILPVSYLLVLGGTFVTFSTVYRKRKAAQSANLSPWFPPHLQRNIYLSLLHMEPAAGGAEKKTPRVPDSVVRAALLRRAVEDIRRIIQIRTGKQACGMLLQRGSVGDDLWQRFQRAEREMEEELRDVVMEANALVPNWGQIIFQTANAIAGNAQLRDKLDAIQSQVGAEKAWWARRKASITEELLSEEDKGKAATTAAAAPAIPKTTVPASIASRPTTSSSRPSTPATGKTDDDGVLVDVGTPGSTASTGGGKKKKGKK
ncbi:translocation protein [Grosmannia clavigera kw1407]|uniref:Translocation protein n=1 Tax=Grosmannia clavigera (strain kw1407 / UAMH 11150) TaxID=655863 RepID=F0XMX7_GROCL|nr:translocation protein [Grosmannia clavigera kw1407]EFX00942.1 translocation protein [Grosmannia clavigera kw1407]